MTTGSFFSPLSTMADFCVFKGGKWTAHFCAQCRQGRRRRTAEFSAVHMTHAPNLDDNQLVPTWIA